MSFAGGPGHRSPFTERAKATKSRLSPRRSSTQASAASARGVQQSLFGKESAIGGKDVSQFGDSSAKVSQLRNGTQPDVKEPTTPTRASEGSIVKGNRRDEFTSFNNKRVGTPVKTPRTAFGTVVPRSPKRPYIGSPKYQKVLLERPAFYNSPAGAELSTEYGKKEVSISELQKRLKRFLQDENIPARSPLDASPNNLDEVPYNISRSPRVNPLFHHDDTVLQVAKGGVAFTAGVDFAEEETCTHSKENAGFHFAKGGVAFTAGELFPVADGGVRTSSPEATPLAPQSEDERNDPLSEASETERSLGPEDFPVHSETEDGSQAEDTCDEVSVSAVSDEVVIPAVSEGVVVPAVSDEVVVPAVSDEVVVPAVSDEVVVSAVSNEVMVPAISDVVAAAAASDSEEIPSQERVCAIVEVPIQKATPEIAEEKAEEVNVETEKSIVGNKPEAKADSSFEEETEGFEILESLSQRFLKFVVLAVMVACMMGFMVLASGSQGLLPKGLVSHPFSVSFVNPSVIPVSVGFIGLGSEHEGMPCLPEVHLGLKLLSTPSKNDAPQLGSAPLHERKPDNSMDLEELKTATSFYKEMQGKLFSDVASLTESSGSEIATDGVAIEDVFEEVAEDDSADTSALEDVSEVAAIEEVITTEGVVTVGDLSEEEQKFWYSDEPEASEEIRIPESPQILLDAVAGPETDRELPADVESDMLSVENEAVPTSEFVPSETTETLSFGSEPEEATPSVEEPSIEGPATEDAHPISEEVVLPIVPSVTDEIATEAYAIVFPVEDHVAEPQPDSTTEHAVSIEEQTTCSVPVSEIVVPEEPVLEEPVAARSLPVATIALFVVTLASAMALMVRMCKGPTVAASATEVNLFPGTADTLKNMGSPVAWPSARSVFDSHVPDRDELDAITSPLKGVRAPKRYGMENLYGSAEPALSAPGVFKAPSARVVVQKPATTWHPAVNGGSTISSSYRQTASYVPTIPSESGISTSTRGASEIDSVCESALTMGAEEWEHLGSFTTTEVVSVVTEGGEEQKVRTPVRRSQRIRNRVSPLPARFNDFL